MVDVEKLKDSIPTPNWTSWKNKRTVTLNQALLLCMNVCPKWYEARDDQEQFLSNLTIWSQYRLYFEDAHDWASGSGWVINYLDEIDIQGDNFVDLKKFARWACEDVSWNEQNKIPSEFRMLAKLSEITQSSISLKINQKWKLKPGKTYPGYRLALFEFLEQEFVSGKVDPPNAHDFIAKLKEDLANGIKLENIFLKRYGIDYKIKIGEIRNADLKSINQSIGNLIIKLSEDE